MKVMFMYSQINMNNKDAAIIKALSELGLRSEPKLTPEQEQDLKRAINPDDTFLDDVEKLFKRNIANEEKTR